MRSLWDFHVATQIGFERSRLRSFTDRAPALALHHRNRSFDFDISSKFAVNSTFPRLCTHVRLDNRQMLPKYGK
jgi:hypothetical protein